MTLLTDTGISTTELINKVQNALSSERVRPLCDKVIVRAPNVIAYQVRAVLTLFTDTEARTILTKAKTIW